MSSPDEVLVCRLRSYATSLKRDYLDAEVSDEPPVSMLLNIIEVMEVAADNIEKRRSFIDETVRAFQNQGG